MDVLWLSKIQALSDGNRRCESEEIRRIGRTMGGLEGNACRVVRWVANQIRDGVVRWMQRHASVVCWTDGDQNW